jgi:glycine betaine/proline transport system permease protein
MMPGSQHFSTRWVAIGVIVIILAVGGGSALTSEATPISGPLQQFWSHIPRLPIGALLEAGIDFTIKNYGSQFAAVADAIDGIYRALNQALLNLSPLLLGGLISIGVWRLAGLGEGLFAVAALFVIGNLELWPQTMSTFALMGTSVSFALALGLPIGIVAAHSRIVESVLTPVLDFTQTMPPFVYLIPAVILFGIGPVPGILATVIYAMPVAIRLTKVGIQQVDSQVVEAGRAFGCGPLQLLFKIRLPLAFPVIAAAINQTIMYALGMVIIASMIGAGGLGAEILRGITRLQFGVGFEAGLAVVLVALLLDRLGRGLSKIFREKDTPKNADS